MNALKLGFDMDGILVDLLGPWLSRLNAAHALDVTVADIKEFNLSRTPKLAHLRPGAIFDELHTLFADPRLLPAMPGAVEALDALRAQGHEIHVVTALPGTSPRADVARANKLRWLEAHLGWIPSRNVHFAEAQHKADHAFDVFVDDRADTLEAYAARHTDALVCGIAYPYNEHLKGHDRIGLAVGHDRPLAAWRTIRSWIARYSAHGPR